MTGSVSSAGHTPGDAHLFGEKSDYTHNPESTPPGPVVEFSETDQLLDGGSADAHFPVRPQRLTKQRLTKQRLRDVHSHSVTSDLVPHSRFVR